jgi:WD40 repeat protein
LPSRTISKEQRVFPLQFAPSCFEGIQMAPFAWQWIASTFIPPKPWAASFIACTTAWSASWGWLSVAAEPITRHHEPSSFAARRTASTASPPLIRLAPVDVQSLYPPVVSALACPSSGAWLAAAGDDHALRIVNLQDGKTLRTILGHHDWVHAMAIDEKYNSLLSCSADGTMCRWNLGEASASAPAIIHHQDVALATLTIDPEFRWVACAGFGTQIWIYALDSNALVRTLSSPGADIRSIAFSADGKFLAAGGRDGVIRIWEWQTLNRPFEQPLHRNRIRSVRFSPDDSEVMTIGEDRRVVRYRFGSGQVMFDRAIPSGRLLSMTFLDANSIAIAGSDNTIRWIDLQSGDELNRLTGHEGSVTAIIHHGQRLISSSYDTTIRIWDLELAHQAKATGASHYQHPVSARFPDSGIVEAIR